MKTSTSTRAYTIPRETKTRSRLRPTTVLIGPETTREAQDLIASMRKLLKIVVTSDEDDNDD